MMGNDGLWTDDGVWFISRPRFAQLPSEDPGIRPDVCTFGEKVLPSVLADSNRVDIWRRFEYRLGRVAPFVRVRKFWQTNDVCHESYKINDVTVRTNALRACRSTARFRMSVRWSPNRPDAPNYLSVGDICDQFRRETCNYTRRDTRKKRCLSRRR